jgi:hypothetical protein
MHARLQAAAQHLSNNRAARLHQQGTVNRPRKAFYRARAHSNPFNDSTQLDVPPHPDAYDWCASTQTR